MLVENNFNQMKKKLLLTLTLAATCITLIAATKPIRIKYIPPSWATYMTTYADGALEFWDKKPYILYLDPLPDGKPRPFCWWAEGTGHTNYFVVETGVPVKNWTRSLRKLK